MTASQPVLRASQTRTPNISRFQHSSPAPAPSLLANGLAPVHGSTPTGSRKPDKSSPRGYLRRKPHASSPQQTVHKFRSLTSPSSTSGSWRSPTSVVRKREGKGQEEAGRGKKGQEGGGRNRVAQGCLAWKGLSLGTRPGADSGRRGRWVLLTEGPTQTT